MVEKLIRSDAEWRVVLPAEHYRVLREAGTEPPYDNRYDDLWDHGAYVCFACGLVLFSSDDKFHSGTGWPSFTQPIAPDVVEERSDTTYGMTRVEVVCARCDSHLGHVFEDGPPPTGRRYCMNSAALRFVPEEEPEPRETPATGTSSAT